jgi:hypothetical protein
VAPPGSQECSVWISFLPSFTVCGQSVPVVSEADEVIPHDPDVPAKHSSEFLNDDVPLLPIADHSYGLRQVTGAFSK